MFTKGAEIDVKNFVKCYLNRKLARRRFLENALKVTKKTQKRREIVKKIEHIDAFLALFIKRG